MCRRDKELAPMLRPSKVRLTIRPSYASRRMSRMRLAHRRGIARGGQPLL